MDYIDLFDLLEQGFFSKIHHGDFNRQLYPSFEDRQAWGKLLQDAYFKPVAEEILREAEQLLDKPMPILLPSERRRFVLDGNRKDFERKYFARRGNLALLTCALCLSGDVDKFLPMVMDYINAILEEWTWVLPAHLTWENNYPATIQGSDLFAADTGATLGQVLLLLEGLLEKNWASLAERMRNAVLQRVVYAPLNAETSHLCWWFHVPHPNNWTPWCVYNSLQAAVACEKDTRKLDALFQSYCHPMTRFINNIFDDGYYPEGPSYSTLASGMLFKCLAMMERMVPGCANRIFAVDKLRRSFNFPGDDLIGNKYFQSYGDSQPVPRPMLSVIGLVAAKYAMPGMLHLYKIQDTFFWKLTNHFGDLEEMLSFFFLIPRALPEPGELEPISYWKDKLLILRSQDFSASLKANNNHESHNHNDLGHFSLFSGDEPIIVDAGTGSYSRQNFNEARYTLWNTRGNGHNAAVFGDNLEQRQSFDYATLQETEKGKRYLCDLSKAYPEQIGVRKYIRTMDFAESKLSISDHVELEKPLPVTINLICAKQPEILETGIKLGNVFLELHNLNVAGTEPLPDMPLRFMTTVWPCKLTRLVLKATALDYSLNFHK